MDNTVKILFVCSGNICRSPAAEAICKKLAELQGIGHRLEIDSAGTGSWHVGDSADRRMQSHANKRGYHLDSVSRKINPRTDFENFDLIIAMDNSNVRDLRALTRDSGYLSKIHRMTDFAVTSAYSEIPDPYYGGDEGFELVLDLLEESCRGLLEKIMKHGFRRY